MCAFICLFITSVAGYLLNRLSWHSALIFRTKHSQLPFCIVSYCVRLCITHWHWFFPMFLGSLYHRNSTFSLSRSQVAYTSFSCLFLSSTMHVLAKQHLPVCIYIHICVCTSTLKTQNYMKSYTTYSRIIRVPSCQYKKMHAG